MGRPAAVLAAIGTAVARYYWSHQVSVCFGSCGCYPDFLAIHYAQRFPLHGSARPPADFAVDALVDDYAGYPDRQLLRHPRLFLSSDLWANFRPARRMYCSPQGWRPPPFHPVDDGHVGVGVDYARQHHSDPLLWKMPVRVWVQRQGGVVVLHDVACGLPGLIVYGDFPVVWMQSAAFAVPPVALSLLALVRRVPMRVPAAVLVLRYKSSRLSGPQTAAATTKPSVSAGAELPEQQRFLALVEPLRWVAVVAAVT